MRLSRTSPAVAAALAWLLAGCIFPDGTGTGAGNTVTRNDGTGTSAGNTVSARVVTLDGGPAAGAEVHLRPEGYIPDSVLQRGDSAFTRGARSGLTDLQGKFTLPADTGITYTLEVARGTGADRQVAWIPGVRLPGAETMVTLGDVGLMQSSILVGNVRAGNSLGSKGLWVGVPGTGAFARVGADGGFALRGMAPGGRELSILRHILFNAWERVPVRGWKLYAGAVSRLDSLALPPPPGPGAEPNGLGTSMTELKARACREDGASLSLDQYEGPARGGTYSVVRTWLNTPQPAWVELDPCHATWRRIADMPPDLGLGSGSFSAEKSDFVQVNGEKMIRVLDTAGAFQASFVSLPAREIEYFGGVFHVPTPGSRMLRVYSDLLAIAGGKATDSMDLGAAYPSAIDFAIEDSIAYWAITSLDAPGNFRLHRFDLRARAALPEFLLPNPGGNVLGMVSAEGGGLWFLDGSNQITLMRMPGQGGASGVPMTIRKIKIDAPGVLSGLARFRSFGRLAPILPPARVSPQPTEMPQTAKDAEGCLVNPAEIVPEQYAGPTRLGLRRSLRAYAEGAQASWVELNVCTGGWRALSSLPIDATKALGSFSTRTHDYVASLARGSAQRYDSAGGFQGTMPLPPQVTEVEPFNNGYYAFLKNDPWLHYFADSASLWNGGQASYPGLKMAYASTWDIAIVDMIVYWAETGVQTGQPNDTLVLKRWSLASNTALPDLRMGHFQGAAMGIVSGPGGTLWILDGKNSLYQVAVGKAPTANAAIVSAERVLSVKMDAGVRLYALTRLRDPKEGAVAAPAFPAIPAQQPLRESPYQP